MAFKTVHAMVAVALVAVVLIGGTNGINAGKGAEKTREGEEIVFLSGDGGVGYVNGTDETADNTTTATTEESGSTSNGSGDHLQTTTGGHQGNHGMHVPIRIGQWMILGCHNNEDTWGCELGRLMQVATIGMIDTLKFTVRKDKSLKMSNTKERCESCVGESRKKTLIRIMVKCPKEDGCNEKMLNRLKNVHFQAGFLSAVAIALVMLIFFACMCKAVKISKRGEQESKARFISKNAVSNKW